VQQHERTFVGHIYIAGDRQRGLALHLIAKNSDGGEIAAQRKLVGGKQCPGRNGKILDASPATETGRTLQAAAIVSIYTATVRANRLTVCLCPADATEGHLGFRAFHLKDAGEGKGLGSAGQEKMLGHLDTYRLWKLSYPIGMGLSTPKYHI
jgi:hypothetical protein